MRTINLIITSVLIALLPLAANAQKKKTTKKQPEKVVLVEEPVKENVNFENMLASTAKVSFVDSIVANRDNYAVMLSISRSAGTVKVEKADSFYIYSYTNSLQNTRYVSLPDKKGLHKLYRQSRLGADWGKLEPIALPEEYTDIICPYLLSDGVTLYFSAKGGEDNIGKHDIFFTVYDTDDEQFMSPQSLGLPYNSEADDLYYVVDEDNNIGHFVTNRRQKSGKVCVYSFIPTEARETYSNLPDDSPALRNFANLNSIAATQTNAKEVKEARVRLATIRSTAKSYEENVAFQVTKNKVYHSSNEFRNPANKQKYIDYCDKVRKLSEQEIHLTALRKGFRNGQTYTKDEIMQLERQVEQERLALKNLATEIRNAEPK